jgi:thioredoxin-related protein
VVKKARKATTAHLFKGGCRVATEGIKFCSLCLSVLSFPGVVFFRQNDRKNIKLTHGNIDKRKNLYLCTFVKNKDTRTEEHKANTMKNNQINICHSAHYVILSKLKSSF